jgi:CRP-like cAMP-binding protein
MVNFFCTYIDENGDEVYSRKAIALHYLVGGRFFIDLAATVPFELLPELVGLSSQSKSLQLFQILKMIRLLRLRRIITYLRLRNDFKLTIRIAVIIFNLFLFNHLIACFWFLLVSSEKKWKPPKDHDRQDIFYDDGEFLYPYTVCLYYGMLMVMGVDILPQTSSELMYGSFVMVLGNLVIAALFGQMTLLLQSLNHKTSMFHEQLDTANQAMTNIGLPLTLQTKVLDYISYTYSSRDQQEELNSFFEMLSPSLKQEVAMNLFRDVLILNPIFSDRPDIIESLLFKMHPVLCKPEIAVFRRGDKGNCMYFISRGSVKIITPNENLEEECLSILQTGTYFGEIVLLTDTRRTATALTENYTTLAMLTRADFDELMGRYVSVKEELKAKIHAYQDSWHAFLVRMLRSTPFLRKCSQEDLSSLAFDLKHKRYEEGSVLVKRRDYMNSLVIVAQGKVYITCEFQGRTVVLMEVGKGGVLFVNSAFHFYSQPFTFVVAESCLLLVLEKENLNRQCELLPSLKSHIMGYKSRFELEEIPRKSDIYLNFSQLNPMNKLKLVVMRVMTGVRISKIKAINFQINKLNEVIKNALQSNKKVQVSLEQVIDLKNYQNTLQELLTTTMEMTHRVEAVENQVQHHGIRLDSIQIRAAGQHK